MVVVRATAREVLPRALRPARHAPTPPLALRASVLMDLRRYLTPPARACLPPRVGGMLGCAHLTPLGHQAVAKAVTAFWEYATDTVREGAIQGDAAVRREAVQPLPPLLASEEDTVMARRCLRGLELEPMITRHTGWEVRSGRIDGAARRRGAVRER